MVTALALSACFEAAVDESIIDDDRIVGRWKKDQEKPFFYTFKPDGDCELSQHPENPDFYYKKVSYEFKEGRLILRLSNGRLDGANKAEIEGDTLRIYYGAKCDTFTRYVEK